MEHKEGMDSRMLQSERTGASSPGAEDSSYRSSETTTTTRSLDDLVSEVESCKNRGNVEFHKGRVLAKHTAGKNLLRDACVLYAEGLRALAQAEAQLVADRLARQRPALGEAGRLKQHRLEGSEANQAAVATGRPEEYESAHGTASSGPPSASVSSAPSPCSTVEEQSAAAAGAATKDRRSSRGSPTLSRLAALSKRADAVRPSLYLNLAACNLLLQEWTPAIACCTQVLEDCCKDVLLEAGVEEAANAKGGNVVCANSSSAGKTAAAADRPPSARHRRQEHEKMRTGVDGEGQRDGVAGRLAAAADEGVGEDPGWPEREAERSRRREVAAKALYRRAAGRVGGGDLDAARRDLFGALRLRPRDAAIRRELQSVEKKLADEEARESLRRKTEEGRRRRHEQQQQQQLQQIQQNISRAASGEAAVCADGGESVKAQQQLAPPAAPKADHDTVTRGANDVATTLGVGGDGTHEAGSPDKHAAGRGGTAGREGPRSREEAAGKRAECGDEEKSEERSEEQSGENPEEEDAFPTWNGGECRDGLYAWNQSIREVQVCVKVPDWARARDIRVDIRRSRLSVAVARRADGDAAGHLRRQGREANGAASALGPAADTKQHGIDGDGKNAAPLTVVLAGGLSRPVQVDECLWTTERAGRVLLYLQKELPADGEPGFEWWASVLDGDPEVDVLTCDAGSDASKYPEHAKRRGAKALWEHQNKTPEERLKEERMREARRQMEEEAEQRQRDLENAMKDPKKAELYRQLQKVMPETSICIK